MSRDPQYGYSSTSSDVRVTLVSVSDESMPDATADEPDTSEVPVLPILCCTSAQSTSALALRCFGTPYATDCLLLCLRQMRPQPHTHHHGLHLCQSPMRRRRFNNQSLLTLMCNPSFHRQHPQQMMIPCHFLTMMIHHHGSIRNQKHRGFLPSRIHQ